MDQTTYLNGDDWPIPPTRQNSVFIDTLPSPIWTETKAKLIAGYLQLFLYITRHGTYIDGFAGPQDTANPDSWAAKLVLEIVPTWFRDFHFCELNRASHRRVEQLIQSQAHVTGRSIEAHHGDFNVWVDTVLRSPSVTDSTATFVLLDQRSCECHWSTVEALANHKQEEGAKKIELFYFFPTGWVHRTIAGFRDTRPLDAWWGNSEWSQIRDMRQDAAALMMVDRIRALGYIEVKAWPIFERQAAGGKTMYHMIHATDHLEAPRLMYRAYKKLIATPQEQEQMTLWELDQLNPDDASPSPFALRKPL